LNNKAIALLKNFSYTLISNLVSLVVSSLLVLVVPKLIGIEEYGYWQLYLFYVSYVGFLHFGWNDGIYLRYGGKEYKELDKGLFFSQFCMLFIVQIVIAIIMFAFSIFFIDDAKVFILKMVAVCLVIHNVRFMLLYILQGTNRIKEYAKITLIDRILYCLLIILLLLLGNRQYKLMIAADIIGRLISLLYAMYCCKEITFSNISNFYFSISETMNNIRVGIKLMVANIASMLIIGVVRLGIERVWDISTFGKVSLTMSISNLMMIFINAVGIIMFPILRRNNESRLPFIYTTMRNFLMTLLLGMLIAFYPLKFALSAWLPQYAESLMFMALVFPICVYEGKMALLINTYLKAMRKEKLLLFVNVVSVILSLISTVTFTAVLKNLTLSVVSIVILLAFRCVLAEMFLSKILNISVYKDIVLEMTMSLIFILTGWFLGPWFGIIIYSIAYGLYLIIKRKDITTTFKNVKKLVRG
jgi:O-antigen/teichoic acid export membrane protein